MRRFLVLVLCSLIGCALPPPDESGQTFVPEGDLSAVRYVKEGLRYMANGRYLDAEIRFQKALIIEPGTVPIMQNIGVSLLKQERYKEAREIFEGLQAADPVSLPLMVWLGKATFAEGNKDAGIRLLSEAYALAVQRDDIAQIVSIARSLSSLYFTEGIEEDAVCFSSIATTLSPTPADIYRHTRLLNALNYPQNTTESIVGYFAVGIPKTKELLVLLALTHFAANDLDSSANYIKEAFLIPSENAELDYTLKLLVYIVVERMQELGKEIDQDIVDSDLMKDLLVDPRLDSSLTLYVPPQLLFALQEEHIKLIGPYEETL